ncbi:MAG: methyltransferase domain-containing protein [Candidatus Aminicenantes bacterium]|nr:MAG: methyltransferase domain-containing protein [Candidatus Aminicenantes bacterium]
MNREEKEKLIKECNWYHSIEIEKGLITPGKLPHHLLKNFLNGLRLPGDLSGLSVLDIGACDGFYSFEAEKRGAKRVVALELFTEHHSIKQAVKMLNSNVEVIKGNVYDLSPDIHGTFDIVLFLGVFYHLRYPLLALDRIFPVTRQYMTLETYFFDNRIILADGSEMPLKEIDTRLEEVSLYQFYRYDEIRPRDFSNWFAPNRKAVETSLWSAGFEPEYLYSQYNRIAFKAKKLPGPPEHIRLQRGPVKSEKPGNEGKKV